MQVVDLLSGESGLAIGVGYALALCGLCIGLGSGRAAPGRWLAAPFMALPAALVGPVVELICSSAGTRGSVGHVRPATAVASALASAAIGYATARCRPSVGGSDRFRRGAAISPGSTLPWSSTRSASRAGTVRFVGQPVPRGDECKHFKVIGTTGTGKTTAIRALLRTALDRGDAAIVADPDGAYAGEFLESSRGDRFLNPFDERSAGWDPFGECVRPQDVDHLARSLIPAGTGEDRNWRAYARTFLAGLMRRLHRAGAGDVRTLHRLLTSAPVDELAELLQDTAVAPYLGSDNARFLASVRAIAATHLAVLEHLDDRSVTRPLSVRRWIQETAGGRRAVLFLPYRATQLASLGGAIAAWMRLAIFETMELGAGDHRLWFVIDELDALGDVDGLKDALVRLRKYGGRCVLGFQSIAQVAATYGRLNAQTIVENCGNTLLLRCSSGGVDGTSQFASRLIGDREVLRAHVSRSGGRWDRAAAGGRTVAWQAVTEPAVLPAEFEQLADGEGFMKLASRREWRCIRATDWR